MTGLSRRQFVQSGAAAALVGAGVAGGSFAADQSAPAAAAPHGGEPKFKLGIVTYMVAAEWDVPTIVKICKNVGVGAVELRTTHKHGVEPALTKPQRQEVRKQFEDAGVAIWGCGTTCEFHSPDKAVVEKNIETCKQFVELVADLGGRGVKVRPNTLPEGVPPEQTLEQIGKALVPCGEAAEAAGVEIWVEVHGHGTAEPANMKTIMETCGHQAVGVTWNSNDGEVKNGSIAEPFALLRPWVRSVHINALYKDAAGVYPYRELFGLLREMNYDRYTLCEVGKAMPTPDSGEEFLRYYKALWLELARG